MLELWKLKRQRNKIYNAYERDIETTIRKKAPNEERAQIEASQYFEMTEIDELIDQRVSDRLLQDLRNLDLDSELPPVMQREVWRVDEHGRVWLTPRGRLTARKLIDDEKSRRLEARARSLKLLLPIITALTGLIGVITGLLAILRK